MLRWLGLSLFLFTTGWATADWRSMDQWPIDTVLKPKSDIPIRARHSHVTLFLLNHDEDSDGVPEYLDWCPSTALNTAVCTQNLFNEGKCDETQMGCALDNSQTSILEKKAAPRGWVGDCDLVLHSTTKDRVLRAGTELTLIDSSGQNVSDLDRENLGKYHGWFSKFTNPIFSTKGGTLIGMQCRKCRVRLELKEMGPSNGEAYEVPSKQRFCSSPTLMTAADMESHLEVVFPKPEEITLRAE